MEAKAIKKPSQKNIKKTMPKMTQKWSQRGSQNGAKIVKNEVLEAPCVQGGSQVASRAPPGSSWNCLLTSRGVRAQTQEGAKANYVHFQTQPKQERFA